jgi:hypothetical protein
MTIFKFFFTWLCTIVLFSFLFSCTTIHTSQKVPDFSSLLWKPEEFRIPEIKTQSGVKEIKLYKLSLKNNTILSDDTIRIDTNLLYFQSYSAFDKNGMPIQENSMVENFGTPSKISIYYNDNNKAKASLFSYRGGYDTIYTFNTYNVKDQLENSVSFNNRRNELSELISKSKVKGTIYRIL